ncbi:hypothetical protein RhiJN_19792 [Ceratobasidium sp. AG-Ba]|nr:hypothetical protein RhiJN_04961 [Ceratobasidium sp. AG-Ba]QRV91774.1 hypothetical protein RhiJN_19792 [Ceratobasidium sp. AG-Ba]
MMNEREVYILNFPNLYENKWMQDTDTLFHVVQCLNKYTEGRLKGVVYMRGLGGTDEEYRSLQLFKSLVGERALENSVLVLQNPSTRWISQQDGLANDPPSICLLDASAESYFGILDQLVHRPAFTTLYQQEAAQKTPLFKTTVGRLLDSYLADDEKRVTCARARLQGKEPEQQDPPVPLTSTPPRTRQRTSSDIAQELARARHKITELEEYYAAIQEQLAAQGESSLALEADNRTLEIRNQELESIVHDLRDEADRHAVRNTKDICVQTDFSSNPLLNPLPTPNDIAALHSQIDSLRSDLAKVTSEKATSVDEATRLSTELAVAKNEVAQLTLANAELEKKANGQEKRADALQKKSEGLQTKHDALEKKSKEVEKEKAELVKENKAAAGAQARVKSLEDKHKAAEDDSKKSKQELDALRKKQDGLEKERQQAIKVSEEILKLNEGLKKDVETAKGQADIVQKQAKGRVSELQKTIEEKDAQLAEQRVQLKDIASAAGAWAAASAEVERLKTCMQTEREQAEARHQAAQEQITQLRNILQIEKSSWEEERDWGTGELRRLELVNGALRMKLKMETMLREAEVDGYSRRITELEEWGQSRWDAVGSGCIIA